MTSPTETDNKPSKSQLKRDMDNLKKLANKLTELSPDQLKKVEDTDIREAVKAATKITKGNARKRQIQYIAKLMSRIDVSPIQQIIDTLDASSAAYVQKFHQLETWRERLIAGDNSAMNEIINQFPGCDRQQLRQLTRSATAEHERGELHIQFRKLFQFLKKLEDDAKLT